LKINVDLNDITTMSQLQTRMMQEWKANVGGKMPGGLMMQFADDDGDYYKVTKKTQIQDVITSTGIRVMPKARLTDKSESSMSMLPADVEVTALPTNSSSSSSHSSSGGSLD
jgi:hypothetical protein